jgi:hypothetical protein
MIRFELPGVLTAAQIEASADHIATNQLASGLIPWFTGHHADPWDHVEAAMALTACGRLREARRAFAWSAEHQAPDGTWPMETVGHTVREAAVDANQCGYFAVGIWHYWLVTGDADFVRTMWPTVRAAIEFACDLQQPGGAIAWARSPLGVVDETALLIGSSCLVLSLRCAMALADLVGDPQPDWELSAARLAHAVAVHPEGFRDQSRYSMEWYYPVLGGAVRGGAALRLLDSRWPEFVVTGLGVRCVADRPWVTAAETCELALALDAVGERDRAWRLLRDVQFLRAEDGGYWTGWVWPDRAVWPEERSTWTTAAILLAADALADHSPASSLFRGRGLPRLLEITDCDRQCFAALGAGSD